MKLMWIGGSHPRHLYYINRVAQTYPLAGALVEVRENLIPQPPNGLAERDRANFVRHFQARAQAEARHFGEQPFPETPEIRKTSAAELNSPANAEFVRQIDPDLVLVFGCGLILDDLAAAVPRHTINLHLGLSPRYRGAATLFWPFYFLEPTYAGTTFHYIVAEPDAGDVVHQVVPGLDPGDGVHDVACKAVVASAEQAVRLLEIFERDGGWQTHRQRSTGKNFLASDFKPQHLRVLYDVYDDDLVDHYLAGHLPSNQPKLFRQF
jgi:methionyl-tRNA formyltransferase